MDSLIEFIAKAIVAARAQPPGGGRPLPRGGDAQPPLPQAMKNQNKAFARPSGAAVRRAKVPLGRPQPMTAQKFQARAARQSNKMRAAWAKAPQGQTPQPQATPVPSLLPPIKPVAAAEPVAGVAHRSQPVTINAAAIRQLVRSRPAAMRTIFSLAEVVLPPLALRQTDRL